MTAGSDNIRGAFFMMAAMAAFTLNDTFMKALSGDVPLFHAIFLRGVLTTFFLTGAAWATGAFRAKLTRSDWVFAGWRTLGEIGAAYFFISALFEMPIANVTAILQSLPLAVTLAGMLFLGEAVGWRRLLAILVGFAGVLFIVRPGGDGFTIYSLYALASVLCVTLRDLATRRISREVPTFAVALAASAGVMLFGGAGTAFAPWPAISAFGALQIAGAAGFLILGYLFSVLSMRHGEIGAVAPFRYTSLLWALALGFLVFGEWPDGLTLFGAAIVAGTGIFTLYRERMAAMRRLRA